MQHAPTHLETIMRSNEDAWDEGSVLAAIKEAVDAETRVPKLDQQIVKRVRAMMKYVFGKCKRDAAETILAPMERMVSNSVGDIADPQRLMEEFAEDGLDEPKIAEMLISMEKQLHEIGKKKDVKHPASERKSSLAALLKERNDLARKAA